MPLTPGRRVGPYEITGALGAGGMGEVYRATDTNLGRQVAIKVLPEAFAQDPERLARFEREARTLASLSHPNIAIVHGFEQGESTRALVMELVEGPTLADRIERGALPLDEALPIAVQVARALEAAHEQAIVHRDLKPANIKVTPDGVVKVLDFGLAKAFEPAGVPQSAATQTPTITTPAMTQAGVILGTAAYMSPEQAKGRAADKRSDVWAFGCVLFEMLTGRRAFGGEDTSDTLASILKTDPDWSALPPEVPPSLRTLVERCLVKDRRERIADLAVASFVLAGAGVAGVSRSGPAAARGGSPPVMRRRMAGLVGAVAAGAALAALGAWALRPIPPARPIGRFVVTPSESQRFTNATRQLVALSPDGRHIAWASAAGTGILLRSVSEFEAHPIPGAEGRDGTQAPVFSPDGESLAFFSQADRTIRRIPIGGGAPILVCAVGAVPYGMSWGASGILVGQVQKVFRCGVNGSQPEELVTVAADEVLYGPQLLPGEQFLLFSIAKTADGPERWDKAHIVVHSLSTGERRILIEGGSDARYLATGHLLYSIGGSVFAVRFDPTRAVVTGGPSSVLEGVRRSTGAGTGATHYATSDTGDLVYWPGPARPTSAFVVATADRSGAVTPVKAPPGRYVHARASRDGSLLAVDIDDGTDAYISTFDVTGATAMRRLTFSGRNRFPVWSPDGRRIAFQSDREGDPAIFVQRIDGSGVERLTRPEPGEFHVPESWSPDGRHLAFSIQKDAEYALWTLSLPDGKTARFRDVKSIEPIGSAFSPDGRWIAYHALPPGASATSSGSGVYVEPFPPTGTLYQAPKVQRDFHPLWSRNGSELMYVGSTVSLQLATVPVTISSGVLFGSPALIPFVLTAGRLSGSTRAFDAMPDGSFVGVVAESPADREGVAQELRVVLNWHEELKRLVPVR